ncbi:Outer membrane lipoprotein Blc [invertebrate metagenome]|uniref:Outer membrane lipoprotein Blc n=1 Tax=invertebrate metagenome TaxID=1711999 RepID=A0A2H9T6R6_9ZZZZ
MMNLLMAGCTGLPRGVHPVQDFDVTRYQGKWYEIARLDHSFERGMDNVTADYSLNDDGSIRVINQGFSADKNRWKSVTGKAKFVGKASVGHLKVSFFGPFYGTYAVFGLDKGHYNYAFVAGPNHDYLWLLARQPQVSPVVYERFLREARQFGFDTNKLIKVQHTTDR